MDNLSLFLSYLELDAKVYLNEHFCGLWRLASEKTSVKIPFHIIGAGEAKLGREDGVSMRLGPGDLVVFPKGQSHNISNINEQPDQESADVALTHMICGYFLFHQRSSIPFIDVLPEFVHIGYAEQMAYSNIQTILRLIVLELQSQKNGSEFMVKQLAYLLFVEFIRYLIKQGELSKGWLVAVFDPRLSKALQAIHQNPEYSWSITRLAETAAMGRSAFSKRFTELMGIPVMSYLTLWRMQIAKKAVEKTNKTMLEIAESIGYESEAAFRKAFKKIMQQSPGIMRREAQINKQ